MSQHTFNGQQAKSFPTTRFTRKERDVKEIAGGAPLPSETQVKPANGQASMPAPTMTLEQMAAQIEALKAENARLQAAASRAGALTMGIGEAGGISLYGLGRFPVTLYAEQWKQLLNHVPGLKEAVATLEPHAKTDKLTEYVRPAAWEVTAEDGTIRPKRIPVK